ncbi:MAG: FtsW/RodA/SpoVE family cell cycle protein [Clostridia bacterium]|nr:FtsW/RodA/SpoVE family cell cycle protein [Clostridia bacterium]
MAKVKDKLGVFIRRYLNFSGLDIAFFVIVIALLSIGLVMLYSASYPYAQTMKGDAEYFISQQIGYAVFGVVVMFIFSLIKPEVWKKYMWVCLGVSFVLLVLVLVKGGGGEDESQNFRRWLSIGGVSFQPSEIAKFVVVLAGAALYSKYTNKMSSLRPSDAFIPSKINNLWCKLVDKMTFLSDKAYNKLHRGIVKESWVPTWLFAAIFGLFAVLIYLEDHLSCCILILSLGVIMMFIGGVRKGWFIAGISVVVVVALMVCVPIYMDIKAEKEAKAAAEEAGIEYVAPEEEEEEEGFIMGILRGYMEQRIVAWLDKDYEPRGARWQTNQGLYAIGSGGLFGKGLGNSTQKYMYVSEPQNDMIFSIVCEELGFIGASLIILLYILLVYRGVVIGLNAKSRFSAMLAMGLVFQIGLQVILNIAVATDSMPNTGISLPFFSYGGTSMVVLLGEMGIVMAVSRESRIKKK